MGQNFNHTRLVLLSQHLRKVHMLYINDRTLYHNRSDKIHFTSLSLVAVILFPIQWAFDTPLSFLTKLYFVFYLHDLLNVTAFPFKSPSQFLPITVLRIHSISGCKNFHFHYSYVGSFITLWL